MMLRQPVGCYSAFVFRIDLALLLLQCHKSPVKQVGEPAQQWHKRPAPRNFGTCKLVPRLSDWGPRPLRWIWQDYVSGTHRIRITRRLRRIVCGYWNLGSKPRPSGSNGLWLTAVLNCAILWIFLKSRQLHKNVAKMWSQPLAGINAWSFTSSPHSFSWRCGGSGGKGKTLSSA
jgi:hypothetical protein